MELDIVTPSLSGLVHHSHLNIVPALTASEHQPRVRHVVQQGMPLIGLARNLLLASLAPPPGPGEWRDMVWVDADTVVEPDTVVRLWERAKAIQAEHPHVLERLIVSGVVEGRGGASTHGELDEILPVAPGVFRTDHVGFGLVFVSGPLIRAMRCKAKAYQYEGQIHHDYFPTGPDRQEYMGEDVGFCRLAFSVGARIYVDTTVEAGHYEGRV